MSLIRNMSLLTIAVITFLPLLAQERGAQNYNPTSKQELRFQNFNVEKSIDLEEFRANVQSRLGSINLHTLNLSQKSNSKQLVRDEPFSVPKSTNPVPNRLGDIEPLKKNNDKGTRFELDRVVALRSFDFTSSHKRDLSDVK